IIIGIFIFFKINEPYAYHGIFVQQINEKEDSLELKMDFASSIGCFHSYKLKETDDGIYELKIKVTPFDFRGKIWPQTIVINEKPESIKAIELTDGNHSRIIYPDYLD
ncbi:MAG: hypothetical protein K2P09_01575, partial [Erysipelotrichales bacterium]|nr:hypothetical protein [Erysipelotrichales bacterium]